MSFYVKRSSKQNPAGFAYVGPMARESQALREAEAWRAAGETAEVLSKTPELWAAVRKWERVTHADDARNVVTFEGQQMTLATYKLAFA